MENHDENSVFGRAIQLKEENRVSIDSKNQVFIVIGFRAKRLVELKRGNTWYCDCNSSKTCCHILAVQLAIGILQPNGKMANAENLVRKSRNKRIGKSGRKQPRTIDHLLNYLANAFLVDVKSPI